MIQLLIFLVIKNFNPIVIEIFIRCRKLNIFFVVFIKKFYFPEIKDVRLNSTYHFIMKIKNKQELHLL